MNIADSKTITQTDTKCIDCGGETIIIDGVISQPCGACQIKRVMDIEKQELKKMRQRDYLHLLDKKYLHYTWDFFKETPDAEKVNISRCYQWMTDFKVGDWLLMRGNQGTGKTLIKNLIISNFGKNNVCKMVACTGYDIYNQYLRACKSDLFIDDLVRKYTEMDCLIIDELGRTSNTDNFANFLFQIVDKIYSSNKSLILISNKELVRVGDGNELYISDFVDADRLTEKATIINFNNKSYRGRK